eukprot:scaffold434_cov186-Pinguiococcus_pyrenoidosus.AAC.153
MIRGAMSFTGGIGAGATRAWDLPDRGGRQAGVDASSPWEGATGKFPGLPSAVCFILDTAGKLRCLP